MDLKKFDKSQIGPIAILILLGGVGILMVFVILPMMHRVVGLRSQIRSITEEIGLVRDFMKTNGNSLTGSLLVSSNDATLALEEITVLGNKHEIVFLSMVRQDKVKPTSKKSKAPKKTKKPNAPDLFNTLPVQIETRSTYKQLGLFLGELNDAHQSIILIDDLQIIQDKREPDKVRSKIQINICLKNENHEQE